MNENYISGVISFKNTIKLNKKGLAGILGLRRQNNFPRIKEKSVKMQIFYVRGFFHLKSLKEKTLRESIIITK